MADEEAAAQQTETTTQPETPAVKTFTQADLDRVAAKARKEGEQSALKKTKEQTVQQPQADEAGEKQLTMKELKAQLDDERMRREFAEGVAEHKLPRDARELLFTAFKATKPADHAAWFDANVKLFGTGEAVEKTATQQPAIEPEKPRAVAPTQPNRVDPVQSGGLVNIFSLTPEQIDAMSPAQTREHFEKILEHARSQQGFPPRRTPGRK
jgi:hypothetical protein